MEKSIFSDKNFASSSPPIYERGISREKISCSNKWVYHYILYIPPPINFYCKMFPFLKNICIFIVNKKILLWNKVKNKKDS